MIREILGWTIVISGYTWIVLAGIVIYRTDKKRRDHDE